MNSASLNNDITDLIVKWSSGDKFSEEKLFSLTYQKFKQISREAKAKAKLKNDAELSSHIIHSTTAIVHDAYLKLAPGLNESMSNQKEFYLLVSKVMRHILVDHHRKRNASKRQAGPKIEQQGLDYIPVDYISIDKAIDNLNKSYPRQAETIQLRYFHGLKNREIAELHNISESLVDKDLQFSKSWMRLHA